MKIKLINPPSPFLINERVFPNIGLVRVATTLKDKGYDTEIIDMAGNKKQRIPKAEVYGFSSTTPQFPYVWQIFKQLKKEYPHSHYVIGGPHVSSLYNLRQSGSDDINIKDAEEFDTMFVGEGEMTNVSYMFEHGWQKVPLIKNLDDVLIPDRELIDIESYVYNGLPGKTTSMQSQRGCPGKCDFCCGRDIEMYNRVRQHSPERVVQEMDELNKKYGFNSFMFYDDELNVNMNRLEKLCNLLSERDYKNRGFIRSDYMYKHPEAVNWLKKAGFIKLCAGVESGSDRILKRINKQTTAKMNAEVRTMVKDAGIHYESFLMIGHPGEQMEDINLTLDWVHSAKPDDFDLNIITPYPGSKIYDNSTRSRKFKGYNWVYKDLYFNKPRYSQQDSFYKGLDGKSESSVRTKQLSNFKLRQIRDSADSYLRRVIKK